MTHWSEFVDPHEPDGAYLPWKKVEPRVGISRTTAWRMQRSGEFPKPYVVSPGRVAYRESEVEAWKASRGHRASTAKAPKPAAQRPCAEPTGPPVATPAARTIAPEPAPFEEPATFTLAQPVGDEPKSPPDYRARPGRSRRKADSAQITFDFDRLGSAD